MNRRLSMVVAIAAVVAAVSATPVLAEPVVRAAAPAADARRIVLGVTPSTRADVERAAKASGARVVDRGLRDRFVVVEVPDGADTASFVSDLRAKKGVRYAEESHIMRATFVPNDPSYASQWHLPQVGAPAAWDVWRGDPTMVIAVVDTGVDLTHPDLIPNLDTVNDWDFFNGDASAQDDSGHGTHVAGLAAAAGDNALNGTGIAGGARILPIKVLDYRGNGWDQDVADGIRYAALHGADIINLSLAGEGSSQVMSEAIQFARAQGCIVVAAAGNDNVSQAYYPAANYGVIGVAATDSQDQKSGFSNYGFYIDIAAPGGQSDAGGIVEALLSTRLGGGLTMLAGTSMAAPLVAGAAGLVRGTTLTRAEAEETLLSTARDLGDPGRDNIFGRGALNIGAAMTQPRSEPGLEGTDAGAVSPAVDEHDVRSIQLVEGKRLTLWLTRATGATGSDTAIRLFGPEATDISGTPLLENADPAYSKSIAYTVPQGQSGPYLIDVSAGTTDAAYQLRWEYGYPVDVTMRASSTRVLSGASVVVTGTVTRQAGGPSAGTSVSLRWQSVAGGDWLDIGGSTTATDGSYAFVVPLKQRGILQVLVPQQDTALAAAGPPQLVEVVAKVSAPTKPSYVREDRTFTSSAWVYPRHSIGSREVKFTAYRLEKGVWRARRSTYGYQSGSMSTATRVSARLNLPYRGKWKIVARTTSDSWHLAGAGTSAVFIVH